jgi:hypothetical protein
MFSDGIWIAFADKEVTRMTVWGGDFGRAVRLARMAYESRKRCPPPDIIAIRYLQPDDSQEVTLHGRDLAFVMMLANELQNEPWFRKTQNKPGLESDTIPPGGVTGRGKAQ